jgi:hypothetical protein
VRPTWQHRYDDKSACPETCARQADSAGIGNVAPMAPQGSPSPARWPGLMAGTDIRLIFTKGLQP